MDLMNLELARARQSVGRISNALKTCSMKRAASP